MTAVVVMGVVVGILLLTVTAYLFTLERARRRRLSIMDSQAKFAEQLWAEHVNKALAQTREIFDRVKVEHEILDEVHIERMDEINDVHPIAVEEAHFHPIVGEQMAYCHAPNGIVIHRKDCRHAPRPEYARYIWAFTPVELLEWAAAERPRFRFCAHCKPDLEATDEHHS